MDIKGMIAAIPTVSIKETKIEKISKIPKNLLSDFDNKKNSFLKNSFIKSSAFIALGIR